MSSLEELLAELRKRDIRIARDGDQLRVSAPPQALTDPLRADIAARKTDLLAFLAGGSADAERRPPIRHLDRSKALPLSFVQERLWFLHQLEPEGSAHNLSLLIDIPGPLDRRALERAVTELLRRHEALRTTFVERKGEPVCQISPPKDVELRVVDLSDMEPSAADAEAERAIQQESRGPFDLARGPLIRFLLLRRNDKQGLLVTQHHIVTDRWSIAVVTREIGTLYLAYRAGSESPLSELSVQYVDFAAWQKEWLRGDELERQLAYWKRHLAEPIPALTLPTDRPRPPLLPTAASTLSVMLTPALRDGLSELARHEGSSLFMILLAAFQLLLSRHAGQDDILVGAPVAGRTVPELEPLVGCFINTLVLRADLSGEPTFRELLRKVRSVVLGALAHQDLPFEKLVEEIAPKRDPSRSPLSQVTFAFQNLPVSVEMSEPVRVINAGGSIFDLSLYVADAAAGLYVTLEYNEALFDPSTAARMLERYRVTLEGAVAEPDRPIHELPLLTAEERERIATWNATERAGGGDLTVVDQIEQRAAMHPDRVAVSCGGESLTYAELSRRSTRLAKRLAQLGAGGGTTIAVGLERSVRLPVALLGVLKTGGCYLPLDPSHPPSRLDFVLRDAGAKIVLTDAASAARFSESHAEIVALDDHWPALAGTDEAGAWVSPTGNDLAYVIYTSGSTGRPKGVEVPHSALANFLVTMARRPGLNEQDVLVAVTTVSFDIAGLELFLPLTRGARVVIATRDETADGRKLARVLSDSGATVLQATPASWRLLLESGWEGDREITALCGGEPLPQDLAGQLLVRTGALWNMYGPTETTIWSALDRVETASEDITIGRPIDNTQVFILDDHRQLVPIGVPGEICIGGAGLARGYRGRPELTEERFIRHPLGDRFGGRLYRTGDLGRYRPDGRLECLGRVDQQIKVRGFRVEPGEIETLLRSHPAVRDTVVVARADRLVAFIVYEPGADLTATEVRRFVATDLPDYMVPSLVVPIHALPLTPNAKVDRAALPDPFGHRAEGAAPDQYVPPRTAQERLLASIWEGLLGIDRVSAHDNFYEVGGHSLLSIRVVHAVEEKTGHRLNPRVMFFQSLQQIASTIPEPL